MFANVYTNRLIISARDVPAIKKIVVKHSLQTEEINSEYTIIRIKGSQEYIQILVHSIKMAVKETQQ
ncbi:hypothetical protein NEMIN01_1950 [Nematocida minor]|uniref:uncharacterized protein n=1 Tax=Nematocida minor TaxID=1912983 RepID=UPI00222085E4|nr:uncharacterized protein NEMIN01_1950 [Nematocida minor]KAI5192336.1 hypothetical protein NEMIN01_1950 [Nematocida minor]